MTATINSTCTSITINSTNFATSNELNKLIVKYNDITKEITLLSNILSYQLTPASLDLTETTLPDAVYELTLYTTNEDLELKTEGACVVSLCAIACSAVEWYANPDFIEKVLAYEGLKASVGCVKCDCKLQKLLYSILNDTDYDCGCNSN